MDEHLRATASVWDARYQAQSDPWRSAGVSQVAARLLRTHVRGRLLLEIGCGVGADASGLAEAGFEYLGIDWSPTAITRATETVSRSEVTFRTVDFMKWRNPGSFDVVYEKGVFHGIGGVRSRKAFIRRVAHALAPKGVWLCICGSADCQREGFAHGAIYLRDLIGPGEIWFEILEATKSRYGLANSQNDFDAWYVAMRRR